MAGLRSMMTQDIGPDMTPVSFTPYTISQPQQQGGGQDPLGGLGQLLGPLMSLFGGGSGGTAASPMGGNFAGGPSAFPNALGGLGMFGGR